MHPGHGPRAAGRRRVRRMAVGTGWVLGWALALGACTTTPSGAVPSPASTRPAAATSASSETPVPTRSETPPPTEPLPTTSTTGWWGDDIGYCAAPAHYRLGAVVKGLGTCLGLLVDPPAAISMSVGQELDLHLSVRRAGGPPSYPLPDPADPLVLRAAYIADDATMTYRALTPGITRLMTSGTCLLPGTSSEPVRETSGPCPVVEVRVRAVAMGCTDVPLDECRQVAAAAVLWGLAPYGPKLVVDGWQVSRDPAPQECSPGVSVEFDVTFSTGDGTADIRVLVGRTPDGGLIACPLY